MTATDELRRLLDERGVKWWPMHDAEAGYREDRDTEFLVYGCKHVAHEWGCRLQVDMLTADELTSGRLSVHIWCDTPEQAIAATLGPGTCKLTMNGTNGCFGCSECLENIPPLANFCPNCGRKVVGE